MAAARSRKSPSYERLAWADRFQKPSVTQLRESLPAPAQRLFDEIRKHVTELEFVREELVWRGDCWKWTIEFHTRGTKPPHDPLAALVPCPGDLQIALPIDTDFSSSLPVKRMKRAVRDGLELAQEPFDTRWSVWSLGGSAAGGSLLEDLQDLIELKFKHLAKRAG